MNPNPIHKIKNGLVSFLISPWFLALIVSALVMLFIPPIQKYKIDLVKTGAADKPDSYVIYHDMNGDGDGEKIILFNNQRGDAAIKMVNKDDVMVGWWNFSGRINKRPPVAGDFNKDGFPEVYFVSTHRDSLFLNILYQDQKQAFSARQEFVTHVNIGDRENDYVAGNWFFCDLQLDGTDEVIFHIFAGYSLQPRRLFAYDLQNDTLFSGPVMGCQVTFVPVQLDNDPYVEFLGQASSTGNFSPSTEIPYSDSSTWLMALDHKLNFLFEPVEFKGHKTYLISRVMEQDTSRNIIALFEFSSINPWKPLLMVYDAKGNLLKKRELDKPGADLYYSLTFSYNHDDERLFLQDGSGKINLIDDQLNAKPFGEFPADSRLESPPLDLDNDGKHEFFFLGNDFEKIVITRNDFSHPVSSKLSFESKPVYFSRQENGDRHPYFFIKRGDREMWFSYGLNPLWYAKFPIWLGIYLFNLGFIILIRELQLVQQKKVKAQQEKLATLQLNSLNTYLDPHFTFNALNTVSSLIYKEEKGRAYELLSGFTSLIRTVLQDSGTASRSLGDELQFARNYLEILKVRYGDAFTWDIQVEGNVDLSIPVPKMMIQQYAENAVKHGMKNKGAGGRLEIILHQEDNEIHILIRDNGIGRVKAREFAEPGTGKGMLTLQQIYELFERLYRIRITSRVSDLFDPGGNPAGTEVLLNLSKI